MYEADTDQRGVYRISSLTTYFSAVKRVLDDAVPDPGESFWEEYGRLDAELGPFRGGGAHGYRGAPSLDDEDGRRFVDDVVSQVIASLKGAAGATSGASADVRAQSAFADVGGGGASGEAHGDEYAGVAVGGASGSGSRSEVPEQPAPDAHEVPGTGRAGGASSASSGGGAPSASAPELARTAPHDLWASGAQAPGALSFRGLGGASIWRVLASDGAPDQDERARAFAGSYGWLGGVFPAPDDDGRYLVEFIDRTHVRVLGYFDRAGRAWLVDEPLKKTPDRPPQVDFARFSDCADPEAELGCVEVREPDGTVRQVARYRRPGNGRIELYATWFDFGDHSNGLTYDDAIARCFFAFCYRPGVIGASVPTRGLVPEALVRTVTLVRAFKIVIATARLAERDAALVVPGAYGMLADELEDAGAFALDDDAAIALAREERSGALEVVVLSDDEHSAIAPAQAMALEHAINRYRLVCDDLGERADAADRATVEDAAAAIVDRLAYVRPDVLPDDRLEVCNASASADAPFAGEWNMRSDLSCALESLRTPYRGAVLFKSSLSEGCAVLAAVVPPGLALPAYRWDAAAGARVRMTDGERADEALRYALRLSLAHISAAFSSAPQIAHVHYESGYYRADFNRPKEEEGGPRAVTLDVDRARFMEATDPGADLSALLAFLQALGGAACRSLDGEHEYEGGASAGKSVRTGADESAGSTGDGAFSHAGAQPRVGLADAGSDGIASSASANNALPRRFSAEAAFAPFLERPAIAALLDRPEAQSGPVPLELRSRLGADRIEDLRITASSARRRDAERLADALVGSQSDTDAVRRVRAFQEQANDPYALRACARVMTALLEGNLDLDDQNAVVNRYLGSDVCMRALALARNLRRDDPRAAAEVLTQAIAAAESQRAFSDTPEVACRVFDGYASRLLYNLDRQGALPLGPNGAFIAAKDRGRTVELVPDALYLCALEAERLMEGSFSDAEEAIGFGKRAVQLAPTAAMGYRQLARSYMLVGDAESSIAELDRALRVATQVSDVAVSYYQLAYVLGQERRLQAAVACYTKAIVMAPFVRRQAILELHDLLAREGATSVSPDEVDHVLEAEGVVVAPTDDVLDALFEGAKAATDAGLFPCAFSLLATYLRHRPDAALVDVLRSLSLEED